MKKLPFITIFLFVFSFHLSAQKTVKTTTSYSKPAVATTAASTENTPGKDADLYIESSTIKAEYPGGDKAFYAYLRAKLKEVMEDAYRRKLHGKVVVQFIVDTLGKTTKCKVSKGIDPGIDARVIAIFEKMPLWKPAEVKGKKVRVLKMIPLKVGKQ